MEALLTRSALQLLLLGLCIRKVIPQCANSPKTTRCHQEGCYLERINRICKPCQDCSEQDLRETSHPLECRAMSYPRFCKYPARNDNDIPTKMVEVQLDSPLLGNFSQKKGKWEVLFYNELAEEGKQENYARVGKVCSQEWQRDKSQWNTFQKARLLCRSGDEEFNYLTDIKRSMRIYHDIMVSFHKDVQWQKPHSLGNSFHQDTFLMAVVVTDDAPLLIADRHFTKAAYQTKISKDGQSYTVFFVGTEDGKILKFLETKRGQLNILEEVTLVPEGGEVVAMEMTKNGSALQVISSKQNDPFLLPLHRCSQMSKCSCPQDPFCIWNVKESECQEYNSLNSGEGFNQSVEAVDLCLRKEIGEPLLMSTYSLLQPTTTVEDIMGAPKGAESKSNPKEDPSVVSLGIIGVIVVLIIAGILTVGFFVYQKWIKPHHQGQHLNGRTLSFSAKHKGHLSSAECCAKKSPSACAMASWVMLIINEAGCRLFGDPARPIETRIHNYLFPTVSNHKTTSTWNSIEITPGSRWRLQGVNAETDKVRNCWGKLVKLKFKGLSPMTSYTITRYNEQTEKISTKGINLFPFL
ncbi:putative semaphorin-6D-like isoform X5 [Apostichopus japonicus]|uniref:Putative semaphorin-6D-like isoform X5 n=1 Tax=Stichopus japonicus TaxID=307972 RepID=A0A2G8LBE0_STIJA|nr:putative semaphorin-6D-like isoform X5 [Apostichopus japonicus]